MSPSTEYRVSFGPSMTSKEKAPVIGIKESNSKTKNKDRFLHPGTEYLRQLTPCFLKAQHRVKTSRLKNKEWTPLTGQLPPCFMIL